MKRFRLPPMMAGERNRRPDRVPSRSRISPHTGRSAVQASAHVVLLVSLCGAVWMPGRAVAQPAPGDGSESLHSQARGSQVASRPGAAGATPVAADVAALRPGASLTITLRTPDAATAVARSTRRELLIGLRGPLPDIDLQALQASGGGRIESVHAGFDSLLLVLAAGVSGAVEADGDLLRIVLKRVRDSAPEPVASAPPRDATVAGNEATANAEGSFRLRLLAAQLAARTGRLEQAKSRFEALRLEAPQRPEPVAGIAAVEQQAGRWRQSLALYAEAATLGSDRNDFGAAMSSIEREQAPRARVDAEHRQQRSGTLGGAVDVDTLRASWQHRTGPGWQLGGVVEAAHVDAEGVLRATGSVERFSGRRERAELVAQYDSLDGTITAASLHAQGNDAGFGLSQRRIDDAGLTTLSAELRRPTWDYVEGIVERASRDRVAVTRLHRFRPTVVGRIEVGLNRYRYPEMGEVARTATLSGDIRWSEVGGIAGLNAIYRFDGEYVRSLATRPAASGALFHPLPILDREVHAATLGYARTAGDLQHGSTTTVDGYAGYGSDRYARSGPIVGAAVTWLRGAVELQLRAAHVRHIGSARSTYSTVGAYLSMRLP